nr:YjiH family protein [Ammoniphilus sp. YIM 78166]
MTKSAERWSLGDLMKFIIPSLLGILLFLVPISYNGKTTIIIGIVAELTQDFIGSALPGLMTAVLVISAVFSLLAIVLKPAWITKSYVMSSLFHVGKGWAFIRLLGAVFALLTVFRVGPEWIWSEYTGGTVLNALIPVLATWFFFSALFMPFLMEFGLMDFIGTAVRKIMRPLFKLPGRSSIDAMASWMGSGTVGVLITTQQYEKGYYTQREASVIATNFSIASIASIAFSLVIATFMGIGDMFVPFYITVVVAGLFAAIVCPRIPPLSRKKDIYYEKAGKQISEEVPAGVSDFHWGLKTAVEQARSVKSYRQVAKNGIHNVMDIYFGLIPLVMGLGTIALVIAEFTPVFRYLSYPLVPILELLQIPEARAAAPAMIVGFADMFLPAVVGKSIESELTRFVIACLSLTQLIYMSEIGILLMKSKIPLNFGELLLIFLQRTLITLPVIALIAHLFFF